MSLKSIRFFRNVVVGSALMTCAESTPTLAAAYAPGTFTFKPINLNVTSFTTGYNQKDSKFSTIGLTGGGAPLPININQNAYKQPIPFGFGESDRNGLGYGIEAGYVVGWDTEVFARAGFCHQKGNGRIITGDLSLRFHPRNNYGFSLGARHYFDFQSAWKPFIGADIGIAKQESANANVYAHNRLAGGVAEHDDFIGKYKMAKSATLVNFEVMAGSDYTFSQNIALTFSVGLRYSTRGGGSTINTPATVATWPLPRAVPARALKYSDNKQHWYIPVGVSLKFML